MESRLAHRRGVSQDPPIGVAPAFLSIVQADIVPPVFRVHDSECSPLQMSEPSVGTSNFLD